jgi:hypothetical protein
VRRQSARARSPAGAMQGGQLRPRGCEGSAAAHDARARSAAAGLGLRRGGTEARGGRGRGGVQRAGGDTRRLPSSHAPRNPAQVQGAGGDQARGGSHAGEGRPWAGATPAVARFRNTPTADFQHSLTAIFLHLPAPLLLPHSRRAAPLGSAVGFRARGSGREGGRKGQTDGRKERLSD